MIYSVDFRENPKYWKKRDLGRKACKALSCNWKEKAKQGEERGRTTQHAAKHCRATRSQDTAWHLQLHWTVSLPEPANCAGHKGDRHRATSSYGLFI